MQKLLRVNAKTGECKYEPMPEKYRVFGKRGLVDRFVFDEIPAKCDPLGPENKLVICTGTFAGTSFPVTGRVSVGGKSPLTGTIKESSVGGMTGPRMAEHEIKLICVEDLPADDDVLKFLYIDKDGQPSLIDATEYSGLGTYAFSEQIRERYNNDVGVMVIGPAGEMLYRSAAIMVSEFQTGHTARAAGRGGLGALMGSKKIKGIVIEKAAVRPEFAFADKEKFNAARARYMQVRKDNPQTQRMREIGSTSMMDVTGPLGFVPYRNFSGLPLPDDNKAIFTSAKWKEDVLRYGGKVGQICHPGCVAMCSNVLYGKDGEFITAGFEYETVAMLGSNVDIFDYYRIGRLDFLCDDIGIDSIEAGCIIGVCMEGGKIPWGDADATEALFDEMRRGTAFGRIMGDGTEAVGKALGVTRIPVVKKQGLPAYDPRGFRGNGITYAVSTMGADHTWGMLPNPAATDDQIPDMVFNSFIGSAVNNEFMCSFGAGPLGIDPTITPDLYASVFGGEWTNEKIREMAIETIKIERMFNEAAGFTDEDDRLPEFFRDPAAQYEGALPAFPYPDEVVQRNINTIYAYKK